MEGGVKKEREDSRQAHRLGEHGSHDLWALRALPDIHFFLFLLCPAAFHYYCKHSCSYST